MEKITYFASPGRAGKMEIAEAVRLAAESPLVQEILRDVGGIIGVLDEHRQIVAINEEAIKLLGLSSPAQVFGLRPGEALGCVHADEGPNGCGTGLFCRSCGAALAIVAAQERHEPVEQECVLTVKEAGKNRDLDFRVRASPLLFDGHPFVLLFVQDVSSEKRREALERSFFHDLGNAVMGVSGLAEMLASENYGENSRQIAGLLNRAVNRLVNEIRVQRILMAEDVVHGHLHKEWFAVGQAIDDVRTILAHHPATRGKTIDFEVPEPERQIESDQALLGRVLANMLINAAEATDDKGEIRLQARLEHGTMEFQVWNGGAIPADVVPRIFQRFFSTKPGLGRGLGTYGMKLIGENYLGGTVSFETSPKTGTRFMLSLPAAGRPKGKSRSAT